MKKIIQILCLTILILTLTSCEALLESLYLAGDASCPSARTENGSPGSTDDSRLFKNNRNESDSKFFIGYRVGVGSELPLNDKISFDTGLFLAGKGNKTDNNGFEQKLNLTYIDVPLAAKYKIGEGGFSVYGGLQPSVLANAKLKTDFNGNEDSQKVKDEYKTFDLAGIVGVGYQFNNGLGIDFGYDHGLVNISDSDFGNFDTKNRVLRLGLRYQFGKKL